MRGKMYRTGTPVYRACDREGERVAIASLWVAAPRRFPIIGNVGEKAQCVRRLPTSYVAHLPLPCVPFHVSLVFSSHTRARVPRFCARTIAMSLLPSAVANIKNCKCRKCLVLVYMIVNEQKCDSEILVK